MRENGQEIVVVSSDFFNCIEVRKGLEGRLDVKSNPEEDNITSCSLSPDCSEVVYGMKSGFVKVFNIATQSSLELSPNHSKQVTYILHSKYNSIFFTCSEDKTIKVGVERGSNLFTLIGHRDAIVMCTEFKDSDGSPLLLSCSKDGTLRAWKISDSTLNEKCLYTTEGHGNQVVTFCDVSPCENYIASSLLLMALLRYGELKMDNQ
ncbi:apoptotic protease-activating factor 1 [Caerostris extrusa]|uniref:Apoptotic protease-activating factor 1 n=1 Tax=Caerostris extrusa TaxID=172846 RepID=A0AAV4VMZ4_CAEEX|nr:apoptotic protease-activating factor 1 [Caerostris extrusa]